MPRGQQEPLTLEECRAIFAQYGFTDDQILSLKNKLICIVDSALNSYLERFR